MAIYLPIKRKNCQFSCFVVGNRTALGGDFAGAGVLMIRCVNANLLDFRKMYAALSCLYFYKFTKPLERRFFKQNDAFIEALSYWHICTLDH